jgi:hypothetical protein
MRMRRVAIAAATALATLSLPAQATEKVTTLYFDNAGTCGTGSPSYVLSASAPAGSECSSIQAGAAGTGSFSTDLYTSGPKAVGYALDGSRNITGTVYIASFPAVGGALVKTVPGLVGAEVTVKVNDVAVGTIAGWGLLLGPNLAVSLPLNLAVPPGLNGKRVKSIVVSVRYTDGSGITGVSYTDPSASKLLIPTR